MSTFFLRLQTLLNLLELFVHEAIVLVNFLTLFHGLSLRALPLCLSLCDLLVVFAIILSLERARWIWVVLEMQEIIV